MLRNGQLPRVYRVRRKGTRTPKEFCRYCAKNVQSGSERKDNRKFGGLTAYESFAYQNTMFETAVSIFKAMVLSAIMERLLLLQRVDTFLYVCGIRFLDFSVSQASSLKCNAWERLLQMLHLLIFVTTVMGRGEVGC